MQGDPAGVDKLTEAAGVVGLSVATPAEDLPGLVISML